MFIGLQDIVFGSRTKVKTMETIDESNEYENDENVSRENLLTSNDTPKDTLFKPAATTTFASKSKNFVTIFDSKSTRPRPSPIPLPSNLKSRLDMLDEKLKTTSNRNPVNLLTKEVKASKAWTTNMIQRRKTLRKHHTVVYRRMMKKLESKKLHRYDLEQYIHLPPKLYSRINCYLKPTKAKTFIRISHHENELRYKQQLRIYNNNLRNFTVRTRRQISKQYNKNFEILGTSEQERPVLPEKLQNRVTSIKNTYAAQSNPSRDIETEERRKSILATRVLNARYHNEKIKILGDIRKRQGKISS